MKPATNIESSILNLRGQRIVLDTDLAKIYGVSAKRLNEQVKRNGKLFPDDFLFQLSKKEKEEVVANCDRLTSLKFSSSLPYAFTKHGALIEGDLSSPNVLVGDLKNG